MTIKAFLLSVCVFLLPIRAWADDFTIDLTPGWNGQSGLTTDYIQRGISQTNGQPSVSTQEVYSFANGLYVGAAALHSKVAEQNVEADYAAGWKQQLTDRLVANLGAVYTSYPFALRHSENYLEFQAIINWNPSWGTVVLGGAFQPQGAMNMGQQTYIGGGLDYNLPWDMKLGGRIGYLASANHAEQVNYVDWTATMTRNMGHGIALQAQYTGLTEHCSNCGNRVVLSVIVSY